MIRLSELIAKAEQVRSNANAAFEALSAEQINWRPSAGQWNIAQCLEHLIRLNEPYFPQIDKILSGQRQASLWERVPLLPAFFGRLVLTAVQRSQRRRSKRAGVRACVECVRYRYPGPLLNASAGFDSSHEGYGGASH